MALFIHLASYCSWMFIIRNYKNSYMYIHMIIGMSQYYHCLRVKWSVEGNGLHSLVMWPLVMWLLALICHTTMCRNSNNFLYNPGHVTLWCLEVVLVVYASMWFTVLFQVRPARTTLFLTGPVWWILHQLLHGKFTTVIIGTNDFSKYDAILLHICQVPIYPLGGWLAYVYQSSKVGVEPTTLELPVSCSLTV